MITILKKAFLFMLLFLLTVILCASCAPETVLQHDTPPNTSNSTNTTGSEGIFEFTITEKEVRIDYVAACNGNITVPKEIQNLAVTEIGNSAFYQNNCSSVDLPSTIRSIQSAAFYRCTNIKDITIPAETVFIDGNPFFRCSALKDIYVQPGNAKYCDIDGVLYNSTGTTLIAYPEGRKETVYEIPEGVTKIANAAFGYNSSIESIIIPESVVDFPDYNLFDTYQCISFVVSPGSEAEKYAFRYGISVAHRTGNRTGRFPVLE